MVKNPSLVIGANRNDLLDLLDQEKVSTGHWNGRRISVPGFDGEMTFSDIAEEVEGRYQAIVEPMQLRQAAYEKKMRSTAQEFIEGPGSTGPKLVGLALFWPWMAAMDVLKWASTPYPVIDEVEEKRVAGALSWRKEADSRLDALFSSSQQDLDRYAESSYVGSAVRAWDSFLDQQSNWRNSHAKDERTLRNMIQNRLRAAQV